MIAQLLPLHRSRSILIGLLFASLALVNLFTAGQKLLRLATV
jgi:hypothetical protein